VTRQRIPVAMPALIGNEKAYVDDCLESTWISSAGEYVKRFEDAFADFCGTAHAITCCNGTVALHLALLASGIASGDEVIVPTLSFVATANAVTYCGARPVFVDSEPETWNMDPALIEAKITSRTKAVIAVHLYGHPVDMDPVLSIARRHGLVVIEDAAEAHGAEYKRQRVGSIGDIATFSFYGNKIITCGEGGMVVTNNEALAKKVHQLKYHGADPTRRYWFPIIGYNYRMTNVAAAIGLGQLEKIEWHLERRAKIASWYRERLRGVPQLTSQREKEWARHVYFMFSVVLENSFPSGRDDIIARLHARGVETRPIIYPIHNLPPYLNPFRSDDYPVANRIGLRGISLPTWAGLSRDNVSYVCDCLVDCLALVPS
jgi:perosamine synthetase